MRRKASSFLREELQDPNINLTPLIDIIFVVLIIFIVIAPMVEIDRVELPVASLLEHKQPHFVQESSPVIIHVREDNSIWLNTLPVLIQDLPPLLKSIKEKYPAATPQLFHDKKAAFGTYQSIKNALEVSGFQELDIVLQP
ncbi:MAG: biopolymer transporter ExbD [Chlamydiae bacterium]|nr:biopolymer transporter ExbD [Chlamydiota bacterium]